MFSFEDLSFYLTSHVGLCLLLICAYCVPVGGLIYAHCFTEIHAEAISVKKSGKDAGQVKKKSATIRPGETRKIQLT